MNVSLSRDVLVLIFYSSDVLMNIGDSFDVFMNVRDSLDILMNVFLSSDIFMNVGDGSRVDLSGVVIRVYNDRGGMDNRGRGSGSVVGISQGGNTSIARESCISGITSIASISGIGRDDSGGSHRQKSRNSDKSLHGEYELLLCFKNTQLPM